MDATFREIDLSPIPTAEQVQAAEVAEEEARQKLYMPVDDHLRRMADWEARYAELLRENESLRYRFGPGPTGSVGAVGVPGVQGPGGATGPTGAPGPTGPMIFGGTYVAATHHETIEALHANADRMRREVAETTAAMRAQAAAAAVASARAREALTVALRARAPSSQADLNAMLREIAGVTPAVGGPSPITRIRHWLPTWLGGVR